MKRHMHQTKLIYLLFFILFIFILSSYAGILLSFYGMNLKLLYVSLLFMALIILLGAAWVWFLKHQFTAHIQKVDDIVDGAIHGRDQLTLYEETSLSSLEHKLIRYIETSKASEQNMAAEKNIIKELLSDISHQTKTPLSNIMVYSQLLEETPLIAAEPRHFASQIKTQSAKLDWLIQSLIKMSRLESGMIALHPEVNGILSSITAAIAQVFNHAESKRITISINCDSGIAARHDTKWTTEAMFNLLENAVKYTAPEGKIHVAAESNEMFIVIKISDTGSGIAPVDLPHIFKRFYRGKNARDAEGVGIGLFLAREIISAQGGYIKVSSTPGQGTTFSIFLPHR
ncbi:two-component sensor histidine kinase [Bacillus sp. FJAT-27264]|uniref:sensor histidine kinase n=1 Tax=Paenibacillus sp. (strain DSM 101736 / FJAT-27264) TaxID=1850362 RepID=UPI000807C66E|nr:HAMP domain-containing sensor histidine kinase [Bacillus sp. FJAT-27264]OBZ09558.1 two-component sensor histidine kinase [Bacillus sp. FJAT-27264]